MDFNSEKLKELEAEIDSMQTRLVEEQLASQSLLLAKSDLQKELVSSQHRAEKFENTNKIAQKDLEKIKHQHTDLTATLETTKSKLLTTEASLKEFETSSNQLKTTLDDAKYQSTRLETKIKDKEEWIDKLEKQSKEEHDQRVKASEETSRQNQAASTELQASLDSEKKEKRALEVSMDDMNRTVSNKEQEIAALQHDKSNLDAIVESLKREKSELTESSTTTAKRLHEELDSSHAKLSTLQADIALKDRSLRSTSGDFEQVKIDKAHLATELNNTKEELRLFRDDSEEAARNFTKQIEDLRREKEELNTNLTQNLNTKTNEAESLKMELASASQLCEDEKNQKEKQKKRANDLTVALDKERDEKGKEIEKLLSDLSAYKLEGTNSAESFNNFKNATTRENTRNASELEALNSEMEEEKKRSAALNAEKSRLNVELDGLKRSSARLTVDLDAANTSLVARSEEIDDLQREVRGVKRKLELAEEATAEAGRRAELSEDKLNTSDAAKEGLSVELAEALRLHGEGIKEAVNLKKNVAQLKDELHEGDAAATLLRSKLKDGEDALNNKAKQLAEREVKIHELHNEVAKLKEFEESNEFMQSKIKKVESELKQCSEAIGESKRKELAAESLNKELALKGQRLQDVSDALHLDMDAKKAEIRIVRETLESVRAANTAKDDAVEASMRKAEVALSGKSIVEKEIEELRNSVVLMSKTKRFAESENASSRRELDALKIESEDLKNRLRRTESALVEARNDAAVGEQVAVLRNQLSRMRSQMVGGDMDEDGEMFDEDGNLIEGGSSPRKTRLHESALMESRREREAYETVIGKLRGELADEAETRRQLITDLASARKDQAVSASVQSDLDAAHHSIRKLEEELANVEVEIAKARRNELNAVATSSEAERSIGRITDDSSLLMVELKESHDRVAKERARADRYCKDLADHEKRGAEMQAAKSRAEATMETAAQEANAKTRALNAMREGEEETLSKLSELSANYEGVKGAYDKLVVTLQHESMDKNAALNEVSRWKEVSELAEKELRKEDVEVEEIQQKVRMLEDELKLSSEFKEQQGKLIANLQSEIANARNSFSENGSLKAGNEIALLRKELETTVNDWGDAEKKRRDREDRLVELKTSLVSEQERNSLLVTNLKLLEDQVSIAREELSVYRQLDVYEASTRGEFQRREGRMAGGRMKTPVKRLTGGIGLDQSGLGFESPLSLVGNNNSQVDFMIEPRSPENTMEGGKSKKGRAGGGGSSSEEEDMEGEQFTKSQLAHAKEYLLKRKKNRLN